SIVPSLAWQLFVARVLFFNQLFCRSSEIVEHVLLFCQVACLVPVFAELAAASNIRHHIDTAVVEPKPARKFEIRGHADSVATVAIKQCRVLPISFHSFSENDVERNSRAVL